MRIRKCDYVLREEKGLRRLIHKLFSTSNQPYYPTLKVRCSFYRQDKSMFERMLKVEHLEYQFEPIVVNSMVVGRRLVIVEGYITLQDKQEKYLAIGTPPFTFLFNDCSPCSGWMTKMLKEDARSGNEGNLKGGDA